MVTHWGSNIKWNDQCVIIIATKLAHLLTTQIIIFGNVMCRKKLHRGLVEMIHYLLKNVMLSPTQASAGLNLDIYCMFLSCLVLIGPCKVCWVYPWSRSPLLIFRVSLVPCSVTPMGLCRKWKGETLINNGCWQNVSTRYVSSVTEMIIHSSCNLISPRQWMIMARHRWVSEAMMVSCGCFITSLERYHF